MSLQLRVSRHCTATPPGRVTDTFPRKEQELENTCVKAQAERHYWSPQFDSFAVQITDFCRDCNTDTISLPLTATAGLAKFMQQGILDILYRQVRRRAL